MNTYTPLWETMLSIPVHNNENNKPYTLLQFRYGVNNCLAFRSWLPLSNQNHYRFGFRCGLPEPGRMGMTVARSFALQTPR